jgi:tRNA A-37 threonylcarbamoyl transferase component Bud32
MARRLPSQPPVLPGFSTINILGSGGFADVFLYEQNMPRRQVAVKVLLSEVVDDHVRRMFQAEANLMARLSSHPSILTVYQAGVSSDGRPYLVMELCSAALSERYRRERIPVAEVLRIAVKIGSAIETAHRAGVLHRDIKPSNILLTAYGHPVLSDFGIASTVSEVHSTESVGLSIPWSAPEVLSDETAGTISSEVWSFAATVYSLLAGRSPFEMAGEPNKTAELTSRILRARVQPTGRSDVPPTLERALARAMSRKPEARQQSILELVRELQAIESELGLPQTAIEVAMDDWARPTMADLEDRTRIRGAVGAPPATGNRRRKRTVGQEPTTEPGSRRPHTSAVGAPSGPPTIKRARPALGWIVALIVGFVIVIVLGVAATIVLVRSNSEGLPRVAAIQAAAGAASVRFTWSNPGLTSSDSYQITTADGVSEQTATDFTQDAADGDRVCITVAVTRGGKTGAPQEKCLNFGG